MTAIDNARTMDAVEVAKAIRAELKATFPKVKFSVRKDGSDVDVSWTDGPTSKRVQEITGQFNGKGFDGMIDLAYSIQAWVKGGAIVGKRSRGTADSGGTVAPYGLEAPAEGCELVRLYGRVSTHRTVSAKLARLCVSKVATFYGFKSCPVVVDSGWGFSLLEDSQPMQNWEKRWSTLVYEAASDASRFSR